MSLNPRFQIGDHVVPKPEWIGSSNNIPSGIVRAIAPFGNDGAIYVGDEKRAFAEYVFDLMRAKPMQGDLFEAAE